MKIITVYPVIAINVMVPDDYDGVIENDINLRADFNETTFDVNGCKLGDVNLCGWNDADTLCEE